MNARRKRALVNLTPLIDVVFILLVFFMLASDLTPWSHLELALPGTAEQPARRAGNPFVVTVTRSVVLLDGIPVPEDALADRLIREAHSFRALAVVVVARDVPVQRVVAVMDQIAGAGITELHLQRASR